MRRRLSYANVVSTLALVLAMSGGALAASHYLINSTKQINPKVLKKLRGARGATGPRGAPGTQGGLGKDGAPGTAGTAGTDGKEGAPGFSAGAGLATAFVQRTFETPIAVGTEYELVLSTKKSGGGKNLVVAGSGARVLIQASLQVTNPGPERYVLTCQFGYEGFAGAPATRFGEPTEIGIQPPGGQAPVPTELSMTSNVALPGAETYDLEVYCTADTIKRVTVDRGSLNAVAYG
ncbi:MAG TPA: hypothetical protein VII03_05095 [Solirubrobacteraceae bacterium]